MAAQGRLEKKLGSRENRIAFYRWAFNNDKIQSSRDLEVWQKFAIVMWAKPPKMGDDWPWTFERQFIVDCNILATNTGVRIGDRIGDFVEVLEGVKPGDRIVLRPVEKIRNGAKIREAETR